MKTMFKFSWAALALMTTLSACSNVEDEVIDPTTDPETGDALTEYVIDFNDFNNYDEFASEGWKNTLIKGEEDRKWQAKAFETNVYIQATAHNLEADTMHVVLTSPLFDIDKAAVKVVSFKLAQAYWKESSSLNIYIEQNGKRKPFTVPQLPTAETPNFEFVFSTNIDLSAYEGTARFVFEYKALGGEGNSTTWAIDDFAFGKEMTADLILPEGPVEPEEPQEPEAGNGNIANTSTKDNPYSIAEIRASEVASKTDTIKGAWVEGYIVGSMNGSWGSGFIFDGEHKDTNILLADRADQTNQDSIIAVELPAGEVRELLNLVNNPANLGKKIKFQAFITAYFGFPGAKKPVFSTIEGVEKPEAPDPSEFIFSETFAAGFGAFTGVSVVNDAFNWYHNAKYKCVAMAAFKDNKSHETEAWLISPAINLAEATSAKLSFEHTINKGNVANMEANHTLYFSTDYTEGLPSTATWTKVEITTYPKGSDWTYVKSGDIVVPAEFLGENNVHFAFKYLSSAAESASWQIKNLTIK